jgi:hypothetical protein
MLLTSWLIQVPWLANLSNCPLNRTSSSARLLEFPTRSQLLSSSH